MLIFFLMITTSFSINVGTLNFILIKKNSFFFFYTYTNNLYFFLKVHEHIFFDINSKALIFNFINEEPKRKGLYLYVTFFFKNWTNLFFQKIKFKGKGYKIRKKEKAIQFFFGRSHLTSIWFKGVHVKRLHKYKLFVAVTNNYRLYLIHRFIDSIRKLNIYTKRGLRLSRQKVIKKAGKKSGYM